MKKSDLPEHLSGHAPQGIRKGETIAQFELGSMRNFVYLVIDWEMKLAAIVDPNTDLDEPLAALAEYGLSLSSALLTHSPHDHVGGLPALAKRWPDLPVYVHRDDLHRLGALAGKARFVEVADGQRLSVGKVQLTALHSPGHSAGELCYLIAGDRPYLLTGDTLFIRDCGRTDFPDGSDPQMFATLQKIKAQDPRAVILPGHHYARECASTLEREMLESPPLRCRTVEELRSLP